MLRAGLAGSGVWKEAENTSNSLSTLKVPADEDPSQILVGVPTSIKN